MGSNGVVQLGRTASLTMKLLYGNGFETVSSQRFNAEIAEERRKQRLLPENTEGRKAQEQ